LDCCNKPIICLICFKLITFFGLGCTGTDSLGLATWSAGGALITANRGLAGAGIQNSGLAFGGYPGSSSTQEYNKSITGKCLG
jgi:hypothetical protein